MNRLTKRQLRDMASEKGVRSVVLCGVVRWVFPDGTTYIGGSQAGLDALAKVPVPEQKTEAPADAIDLEGLSAEEREKKVLEFVNAHKRKETDAS